MAVTQDIVESWRRPAAVVRRLLERGASEPFAFSLLVTFLLLALVGLAPLLAREAFAHPEIGLMGRLYAATLGLLLGIPVFYLLAACGHLVARALGGRGSFYGGRLALFWALVATTPAILLHGLAQGFLGVTTATTVTGMLTLVAFLVFWAAMLREVER
jgi:hypothetical protein